MTLQVMPDVELVHRGWQAKQREIFSEPDFVYRKPGWYGWFDRQAAWQHQHTSVAVAPQYPIELMPPLPEGMSKALTEKEF